MIGSRCCARYRADSGGVRIEPGWYRQTLLSKERRVVELGLIAGARIREDGDDGVAWPQYLCQFDRPRHIDSAGAAQDQALVPEQAKEFGQSLLVGDLLGPIDRCVFEIGGNAALADAFSDRAALSFEFAMRNVSTIVRQRVV